MFRGSLADIGLVILKLFNWRCVDILTVWGGYEKKPTFGLFA